MITHPSRSTKVGSFLKRNAYLAILCGASVLVAGVLLFAAVRVASDITTMTVYDHNAGSVRADCRDDTTPCSTENQANPTYAEHNAECLAFTANWPRQTQLDEGRFVYTQYAYSLTEEACIMKRTYVQQTESGTVVTAQELRDVYEDFELMSYSDKCTEYREYIDGEYRMPCTRPEAFTVYEKEIMNKHPFEALDLGAGNSQ